MSAFEKFPLPNGTMLVLKSDPLGKRYEVLNHDEEGRYKLAKVLHDDYGLAFWVPVSDVNKLYTVTFSS